MKILLRSTLMLSLLTGGCMANDRPHTDAPPPVEDISFSLMSWGSPVSSWRVRADGSGEWTMVDRAGQPKDAVVQPIVTPFPADPAHMRELRAILSGAEAIAPDGLKCRKEIYDLPYGFIEWSRADGKRRINFDLGCTSKQAEAVYGALKAADEKVGGWAEAAKKGKTP